MTSISPAWSADIARQPTRCQRSWTAAASLRAMALGLVLAGCSSTLLYTEAPTKPIRTAPPSTEPPSATQREHQRILAAYNGAYEDPKLEGLLNYTVAKARGRIRAAGHAIPRHDPEFAGGERLRAADRAALHHARADRARQRHLRAGVGPVARDVACDRQPRRRCARTRPARSRWSPASSPTWAAIRRPARLRSPNPRSSLRASRARRSWRPTASASASPRGPDTIPTARCAS